MYGQSCIGKPPGCFRGQWAICLFRWRHGWTPTQKSREMLALGMNHLARCFPGQKTSNLKASNWWIPSFKVCIAATWGRSRAVLLYLPHCRSRLRRDYYLGARLLLTRTKSAQMSIHLSTFCVCVVQVHAALSSPACRFLCCQKSHRSWSSQNTTNATFACLWQMAPVQVNVHGLHLWCRLFLSDARCGNEK